MRCATPSTNLAYLVFFGSSGMTLLQASMGAQVYTEKQNVNYFLACQMRKRQRQNRHVKTYIEQNVPDQ